jgi:indole-3-glycerol phosphate synthase
MLKRDVLKEIILKKQEKIILAKGQLPLEVLKEKITSLSPVRPFIKGIVRQSEISLIAEIKKASPSQGIIREDFNPLEIALQYKEAGAAAISILTEEDYFQGNLSYIRQVKDSVNLPILRKDFIIDIYQIYESRFFGADAILFIAELLSKDKLSEFLDLANSLGLECLVEVHNEKELKKTLSLKKVNLIPNAVTQEVRTSRSRSDSRKVATFGIGINNRDLHTLETDFKVTERLLPLIPKDKTVVIESGIKKYQDVLFLKILGVKAVLIGEAFMEASDIKQKVKEIMGW